MGKPLNKKPEILAPAGDEQSLKRAVMAGADAVYLGLKSFSARAGADNFNIATLRATVDFCHLYGVKVYVAFNTLIKDSEISEAINNIKLIESAGADGIIIADAGLFPYLNDISIPVHISTQAGVHNLLSAAFFEKLGADRVVLARETLPRDIEEIRDNTLLEIEYFVQGALCVSFSGSCLMAGEAGGGSGNRGTCSQPCRLAYELKIGARERREYMLSASDLCLLGKLNELFSLGITSFKIEGRMRRPEYVAEAVRAYRRVLDGLSPPEEELPYLKRAFNRGGYTEGYMYTDKVMSTRVQGHTGEECGKVLKVFKKGGYPYAEVFSSIPLTKGDGLKILRQGAECGGADITSAEELPGGRYIIPVSEGVAAGDTICLTTDKSRGDFLNSIEKRLPLEITLTAQTGKPLAVSLKSGEAETSYASDFIVPIAESLATPQSEIAENLSRLGDTPFYPKNIEIISDGLAFVPKSQLNRVRREAVAALTAQIIARYPAAKRKNRAGETFSRSYGKEPGGIKAFEIAPGDKIPEDATHIVYRPGEFSPADIKSVIDRAGGKRVYLALPKMITNGDMNALRPILCALKEAGGGIFAENPAAVELARRENLPYGGELNIFNTGALKVFYDADFLVAAYELSAEDARPLLKAGVLFFESGYHPVMILRHCPIKLTGGSCANCSYKGAFSYIRGKKEFRAVRTKLNTCTFTVYSSEKRAAAAPGGKRSAYINLRKFD